MGFANDGSNPRLRLLRGFSIFGGRDYQHSRPGEQCMIPKCSMVLEWQHLHKTYPVMYTVYRCIQVNILYMEHHGAYQPMIAFPKLRRVGH
jgi:hypothetical protein